MGKTRIGYELFAQTFSHIERWVLNQDEFIVPNGADGRLLQPQLAEGVLPLYIRYQMACDDDLFADNWVAHVASAALELVAQPTGGYDVPLALLEDLRAALKARQRSRRSLSKWRRRQPLRRLPSRRPRRQRHRQPSRPSRRRIHRSQLRPLRRKRAPLPNHSPGRCGSGCGSRTRRSSSR